MARSFSTRVPPPCTLPHSFKQKNEDRMLVMNS